MADSLIDGSYALITQSSRAIGEIIPDITIEEVSTDTLRITDHPVEVGAAVSDHAFKMPCELLMRVGWSDSSGGYEGYSAQVYDRLLRLQASREPFTVFTGKRIYRNMLIAMLVQATDAETEHGMIATVMLRGINLTQTQSGGGNDNSSAPQQTSSPANLGIMPLGTSPTLPAFTQIPAPAAA